MNLQIYQDTKILVITPHPDDESIAMGGFLRKYNSNCTVLLCTNGALGNPEWDIDKTIEIRKKEFISAMNYLEIKQFFFLNIMDQKLRRHLSMINKYIDKEYDYIFLPNVNDNHPDHKCIYSYVRNYLRFKRIRSTIVEYEVWTPILNPNYFLDISDVYETKISAIKKYECQLKHIRYDKGILGLNRYRGMLCNTNYTEAFYVHYHLKEKIKEIIKKIFTIL